MRARLALAGVAAAVACSAPAAARAQVAGADVEEAYLTFRYAATAEVVLTALYRPDSVYLPMRALFEHLQLDISYDASRQLLHGFYIRTDNRYEVDLGGQVAHLNGSSVRFDTHDFIIRADEVYVTPSLLTRVFGLAVEVDLRELALRIEAPEPLPIEQSRQRERRRVGAGLPETLQPHAPMRFPRHRHALSGGALQYAVTGSAADHTSLLTADLATAAEVLGGDLQASYSTSFGGGGLEQPVEARWRYVFDEDSPIQQVQVGRLTTRTMHGHEVDGARVTNEPVNPRISMGTYLVVGEAGPHWEVELYLNDQLVDFATADEQGRFRFQVPLSYGGSLFSLKYYGPNGEVVIDQRRIEVPPAFVPAGVFEYDLSAGRARTLDRSVMHARAHYGLTSWLTTGAGLEHVDVSGRRPAWYATAALRLPESFTVGLETMPGYSYRGTIQGAFPSLAYFFATAGRAERDAVYNSAGASERLAARGYAPVRLLKTPLALTLAADRTAYWVGGRTENLHADVLLNLPRFKPSIGYTVSRHAGRDREFLPANRVELGAFFAPSLARRGPRRVGDLFFDFDAEYDLSSRAWHMLRLEVARSVGPAGRALAGFERHPQLNESRFEVRYQLDLASVRMTTAVRSASTGGASVSQSARGAVVFDPRYGYVGISARDQVGRAGATFRMYFDHNGDGAFTPGEPVIPGAAVRFRQSASVVPTHAGLLRAEDLLPYNRYTVHVDPTRLPNPLWLPEYDAFSFVSDPNSFKPIDIPFYAGAVVEGRVAGKGDQPRRLAGLRVLLQRLDGAPLKVLETFSDGIFYAMGVPPGEYEVRLDEAQLSELGLTAKPAARRLTVRALPDGDAVEGIGFTLKQGR